MGFIDFHSMPLVANAGIFLGAAVVVWLAGTRLAEYADEIGERTNLGQATVGMLLLGVGTSLPELVTTITGAMIGNASLVTGNLFGGVALQITVLAVVDAVAVPGALTYVAPQPALLFQGVMLLLMLSLALAGAAAGEPVSFLGVGMTPVLVTLGYLVTLRVVSSGKWLPRWRPTDGESPAESRAPRAEDRELGISNRALYLRTGAAGAGILLAGTAVALTGDALAAQTGLGSSFVGVALVAASTSLPELSTSLTAVRHGKYQMAVSNILGTNLLEVAMFLLADAFYRGGPILAATDRSGMFAAAVGLVVTCLMLLGLLERRDRTVARMGFDSLAILVAYAAGLVGLYHLR